MKSQKSFQFWNRHYLLDADIVEWAREEWREVVPNGTILYIQIISGFSMIIQIFLKIVLLAGFQQVGIIPNP